MEKAPIKFKHAVCGRFTFLWHLCNTWKGMETLIKQAFWHNDILGGHIQEGHYALMGPDGEIIFPRLWDAVIKPDWEVTKHMWPLPQTPKDGAGVYTEHSEEPTSGDFRSFGSKYQQRSSDG
jgi:hypothetical protein